METTTNTTKTTEEKYTNPRAPEECYAKLLQQRRPDNKVAKAAFFGAHVEVYRLGVFLFQLLTGEFPFRFEPGNKVNVNVEGMNVSASASGVPQYMPSSPDTVLQWILEGRVPALPDHFHMVSQHNDNELYEHDNENSLDMETRAVIHAIRDAMTFEYRTRPSAKRIARRLQRAVDKMNHQNHENQNIHSFLTSSTLTLT
jgi:serine/threonine protein kinase